MADIAESFNFSSSCFFQTTYFIGIYRICVTPFENKNILRDTLNSSESIWPPPFSTGVYRNKEPSPEGHRDKDIPLSQFILSLFEGVGQLLPGDFAGLLMCRPRFLAAGESCCQKVLQRFSESI